MTIVIANYPVLATGFLRQEELWKKVLYPAMTKP